MHTTRFELVRVAPADLESAALDRSATRAGMLPCLPLTLLKSLTLIVANH